VGRHRQCIFHKTKAAFTRLQATRENNAFLRREDCLALLVLLTGYFLAGKLGLQTGFVPRPLEHGPGRTPDPTPDPSFTVVANDFMDLAEKLNV